MLVSLIGKLQDGVVFDQRGHEGDEPFEFMVDEEQVSDCLEEAVLTMREGEIALFTIPPQRVQDQLVVVPSDSSVIFEIELVSVVNDKHPWLMSRAESIEAAAEKEKEGDKLFSSSKFLRAYRRYYKARQIVLSCFRRGEINGEIKQMLISFAFKAAECAVQLRRYEQAYHCYREVLEYDRGNVKAQKMAVQAFPEASLGIDTAAMRRGLEPIRPKQENYVLGYVAPGFSDMRLKQGHKYHGRNILSLLSKDKRPMQAVPAASTGHRLTLTPTTSPGTNTATTNSRSHDSIASSKGLASCFRCISSASN